MSLFSLKSWLFKRRAIKAAADDLQRAFKEPTREALVRACEYRGDKGHFWTCVAQELGRRAAA